MGIAIQSLMLCNSINNIQGGLNTLEGPVYEIFPFGRDYPVEFVLPLQLLLRKDVKNSSVPFSLHIRVVDQNPQIQKELGRATISETFPAGYRFWSMKKTLKVNLPSAGVYSVLASVETHILTAGSLPYRYDFEAKGQIEGLLGQHLIIGQEPQPV